MKHVPFQCCNHLISNSNANYHYFQKNRKIVDKITLTAYQFYLSKKAWGCHLMFINRRIGTKRLRNCRKYNILAFKLTLIFMLLLVFCCSFAVVSWNIFRKSNVFFTFFCINHFRELKLASFHSQLEINTEEIDIQFNKLHLLLYQNIMMSWLKYDEHQTNSSEILVHNIFKKCEYIYLIKKMV